jgi:hypothetical protein
LAGLVCCKNKQEQVAEVLKKSEFRTEIKHGQFENIKANAVKKIDDWQEYDAVNDFLSQYKSISPSEALNNSRELNSLVESLKDSVKPEFLELDAFNARVNLLYNETLRLNDMSAISSIRYDEVNEQVSKVIHAFSSVNSKINTLVQQADLEAQLNDPKFGLRLKDSLSLERAEKLEVEEDQTFNDKQMPLLYQRKSSKQSLPQQKPGKKTTKNPPQKLPTFKLDEAVKNSKKKKSVKKLPSKKLKPKKKKDN